MVQVAKQEAEARLAELAGVLSRAAEPLPALDDPAFATLFSRLADKRVVALGEATHGTSEFYRARAAITRHLIEHHGFSIVAVEADWPDAARIDDFVRHCARAPTLRHAFERFPTWMWRNAEIDDFIRWLRRHNAERAERDRVEFRGLDVYSLSASIEAVLEYLEANDPEGARDARRRYGCLHPWQEEPERYGHAVMAGRKHSCEEAVVEQLQALLEQRLGRAIGVIYRPETELASHYYDSVLADQFDAFVWFEETRAVTPLPAHRPHGVPDTYPFGV